MGTKRDALFYLKRFCSQTKNSPDAEIKEDHEKYWALNGYIGGIIYKDISESYYRHDKNNLISKAIYDVTTSSYVKEYEYLKQHIINLRDQCKVAQKKTRDAKEIVFLNLEDLRLTTFWEYDLAVRADFLIKVCDFITKSKEEQIYIYYIDEHKPLVFISANRCLQSLAMSYRFNNTEWSEDDDE